MKDWKRLINGLLKIINMNKVKFHYAYPLHIDIDTTKSVEVYIDCFNPDTISKDSIRIVIIEEALKSPFYNLMRNKWDLYTHLLTYQDEILTENPKARLFHCINTWVKGYVSHKKFFDISFIVGGKKNPVMEGYELRHEVWRNKYKIITPKLFYVSGNTPYSHTFVPWSEASGSPLVLGDSKEPLFESMFHIAIENTSIKNYFTEKLIDCFQTRTVPIYYGCKNVEEFFNIDGILVANDLKEIINISNQVTPTMYNRMIPAMEDNYNRSMAWVDHDDQIKTAVIEILKEEEL